MGELHECHWIRRCDKCGEESTSLTHKETEHLRHKEGNTYLSCGVMKLVGFNYNPNFFS